MNEPFSPRFLKLLFAKLVREVGRQDAAAAILGISRQRVGQLCDTRNPEHAREVPTFAHVWTLEQELGRSVVFQGLAEAVTPSPAQGSDVVVETHEVVLAAAKLLPLALAVKSGSPGAREAFDAAVSALAAEVDDVERIGNVVKLAEAR